MNLLYGAQLMASVKRVLLVEDEPLIAMMVEDFLDVLGHQVAGIADDVAGALPLVAAGELDVAILDVNLRGGEKSWPIADALSDRGIGYVLATGGGDDGIPSRHKAAPRLLKPFTIEGVEQALAAV